MNRTTTRAAALLARMQPWRSECCCMHARVRFRSSVSAAAINSIVWESSSAAPYSHTHPELQLSPQPGPNNMLQATPIRPKKKSMARTRTKSKGTRNKEEASLTDLPTTFTSQSTSTSLDAATSETYQGPASVYHRIDFPELEPAPFPKDIHSCVPLDIQESRKMTLAKGVPRSQHTDLKSFSKLNHNTKSTIYRGTLFEYQTQSILRKCLGIYTHRSAGNDDRGVDLRGTWFLPTSASPKPGDLVRHLKVIVQCKSMSVKVGPKYVRELQGSLSYETQPTMAVLAINSDFTKMALLPYVRSLWPMALVVIDAKNHQCSKLIWNNAAEKVMQGIHIGTGWTYGDDGIKSRPALCFDGKVINRIPGPYLRKDEADTSGEKKAHLDPSWCINAEPEFHYVDPDTAGFWGGIEGEESEEVDMGFAHFHSAYEMKEFLHGERAP